MSADSIGHNSKPDMVGVGLAQALDKAYADYRRHYGRHQSLTRLRFMIERDEEAQKVLEAGARG